MNPEIRTCTVPGCDQPRYKRSNRCHEHYKVYWREVNAERMKRKREAEAGAQGQTNPTSGHLIPANATRRVEYNRLPSGRMGWGAFADGKLVATGDAPERARAEKDAWGWLGAHKAPVPAGSKVR